MPSHTKKRRNAPPPAGGVQPAPVPARHPMWPLLAGLGVLWTVLIILIIISKARNQGFLGYALDDAYIHMAIARNIVQHGVWGVTPHEFDSASSSYLWTLLLSFTYLVSGVREITPLLLNALFGTLLVAAAWYLLRGNQLPSWYQALILICLVFAMPMAPLIFSGMEHVLHALLVLLLAGLACRELAREPVVHSRVLIWVYALAPLAVLARFESLAVAGMITVLFLLRRRWISALIIAGLIALAVVVPGLISMSYAVPLPDGGTWRLFMPVSVVMKLQVALLPRNGEQWTALISHGWLQLTGLAVLGLLLLLAISILIGRAARGARWWDERQLLLLLALAAVLFHAFFGRVGWLNRYEAYVVVLGIFAVLAGGYDLFTRGVEWVRLPVGRRRMVAVIWGAVAIIGLVCLLPVTRPHQPIVIENGRTMTKQDRQRVRWFTYKQFGLVNLYYRIQESHRDIVVQTTNIYQQQVQMARFLHRYYDTAGVVANDIGAITYYTRIRLLDLEGLGTMWFLPYRKQGLFDTDIIRQSADRIGARLAIVYDNWYRDTAHQSILPGWTMVGQWKIPDNRICGGDVVSFYAVDPVEAPALAAHLREFTATLPPVIEYYINPSL